MTSSRVSRPEKERRMRLVAVRFPDLALRERFVRAAEHAGVSPHHFALAAISAAVRHELTRSKVAVR